MAAYLLSPPGMPWTDANGDPLNGGLIYVYLAGTSTAADSYPTYADAVALTNPNTNPVVLNATGLPSSGGNTIGIWLASGLYKIIVRNSAGVLIQTQDSVGDNSGADTLPPDYIAGLELTIDATDAEHDVDIATGVARDGADTEDMALSSALVKQIDAVWAVGTNAGGLDTGAVAADTQYYVWLIKRTDTGVVDVLFSLSDTSPTLPPNYDKKRIIGTFVTDSSANLETLQSAFVRLMNGRFGFSSGTAESPAVTFTLDPNTGLYRIGADHIGIATGGALRMRVDANGYVGIGVATGTALANALTVEGRILSRSGGSSGTTYEHLRGQLGSSLSEQQTSANATPAAIHTAQDYGNLVVVSGVDASSERFVDIVAYGLSFGTPQVIASTATGSAASRTYANGSGTLTLQMGSGTYTTNVTVLGTRPN